MGDELKLVRIMAVVFGIATVTFAFVHGSILMGQNAGIFFAVLAAGSLFVAYRCFTHQGRFATTCKVFALLVTGVTFAVIAFPGQVSDEFADDIQEHRLDVQYRPLIKALVAQDNRFDAVSVQMEYTDSRYGGRSLCVSGTVEDQDALSDLEALIFEKYPELKRMKFMIKVDLVESSDASAETS